MPRCTEFFTTATSRFLGDENGTMTVEFVVWVMPFLMMLALVVDGSMVYLTRTEMFNVSRDVARQISVGEITTSAQAEDAVRNTLVTTAYDYTVDTTVGLNISVRIATSLSEASVFGILGAIPGQLSAEVTMRREPV